MAIPSTRYAIYFAPSPATVLALLGARWLGRNAETGTRHGVPWGVDAVHHRALVAAPARYGLHATLKAPFRLAEGHDEDALIAAVERQARVMAPVRIGRLKLARISEFFALVPGADDPCLNALAETIVRELDCFRAPPTDKELVRRRAVGLSRQQERNLFRWGYPHVFSDFRLHMTLTGPVAEVEANLVRRRIEAFFAPVLGRPLVVDRLAVFAEPAPGAPFRVVAAFPLTRASASDAHCFASPALVASR